MVTVFSDPAGEDPIGEVARLYIRSKQSMQRDNVMESHSPVMYWESTILMFFFSPKPHSLKGRSGSGVGSRTQLLGMIDTLFINPPHKNIGHTSPWTSLKVEHSINCT